MYGHGTVDSDELVHYPNSGQGLGLFIIQTAPG